MQSHNTGPRSGANSWITLFAVLAVGLGVLGLLASGPGAWAMERQSSLHQTVPTNTPTPRPSAERSPTPPATSTPTTQPTSTPTTKPTRFRTATPTAESEQPTATPVQTSTPLPPTATPVPTDTPLPPTATPTAVPAAEPPTATPLVAAVPTAGAQVLLLNQSVDSPTALPGGRLLFTLLLTNPGPKELRDVRVEDMLPSTLLLQNVEVYLGQVNMAGNRAAILLERVASGLTSVITVSVRVADDAPPGEVIEHSPVVTIGAVQQRWPVLAVALPPAELPATGGHRLSP